MAELPRIVILGGGFGGVYTALRLEALGLTGRRCDVTLVTRDNYFLMTPLLFEAGSGVIEPRHAVMPIRPLLGETRFIEAEVEAVDVQAKIVRARHAPTMAPYELPYDHVVFALGGVTNRAIIAGSAHARPFKTLGDAIFLRNHLIDVFEQADVEPDPVARAALLTFVVMGAGLVGVELMGELTEFLGHLRGSYPRLQAAALRFVLVEAGPKMLGEMDRDLAAYAERTLAARGVEVWLSTPVAAIAPGLVTLQDGRAIATQTAVLATGVAANPLLAATAVTKDAKGRVAVEASMRAVDRPDVWALGDCAAIPDPAGSPYPPLAQHALREARVLGDNLAATLAGRPLQPFVYQNKGTLASLGLYKGVGDVMGVRLSGFLAWWVWRTYYMLQMPRWERRLRLVIDWTVALCFKNDVVKLDFYAER